MHFPGFPAPPLVSAAPRARLRCAAELASPCWPLQGLLFKICTSIENWLNADPLNVAVVHCMVRRGAGGLSSHLSLPPPPLPLPDGQGPHGVRVRLRARVARRDGLPHGGARLRVRAPRLVRRRHVRPLAGKQLASRHAAAPAPPLPPLHAPPRQARYTRYFDHVLHGVKPRPGPAVLRRVIINGIPDFSKPLPPLDDEEEEGEGGGKEGAAEAAAGAADSPAADDPLRLGAVGRLADSIMDAAGERWGGRGEETPSWTPRVSDGGEGEVA